MAVADEIADNITAHSVDLLKVEAGIRRKIVSILKDLQKELIAELAKADIDGVTRESFKRRRLEKLLKSTRETIRAAMQKAGRATSSELRDLAALESEVARMAINTAIGVDLVSIRLSREILEALANDTLIQGAPNAEWWAKQAKDLQASFSHEMRMGVARGEALNDLVRRIRGRRENGFSDGIMATATRRAEILARTAVQTVANSARLALYKENDDVIKGIEWVSTLDTRTTDTCKALDGLVWDLNRKPVGHKIRFPGPTAHWGCRSTQVPVLKSWRELSRNKRLSRRLKKVPEGTRESMDGQVPESLHYEQWLKRKEKAEPGFARKVLGDTKYRLWKAGKLRFMDLIDQSANPLTVKELTAALGVNAQ